MFIACLFGFHLILHIILPAHSLRHGQVQLLQLSRWRWSLDPEWRPRQLAYWESPWWLSALPPLRIRHCLLYKGRFLCLRIKDKVNVACTSWLTYNWHIRRCTGMTWWSRRRRATDPKLRLMMSAWNTFLSLTHRDQRPSSLYYLVYQQHRRILIWKFIIIFPPMYPFLDPCLAGLFLLLSAAMYSLIGTLHSVLTSTAIEKRFKIPCSALCIASAGLNPFLRKSSRVDFGMSIQKPVDRRSNGGISRSTESRITLFLQKLWVYSGTGGYQPTWAWSILR